MIRKLLPGPFVGQAQKLVPSRHVGAMWAIFSSQGRCFSRGPVALPQTVETEVLIVGGGPVGLSLSILLSQLGVRSLLVEKKLEPTTHPQAHFINNRTMEIFRQMVHVAATIEREQPPLEEWRRFIYCHTMTGTVIGQVDHFSDQTHRPKMSPTSVAHFSQNRLVPLLLKTATGLGAEAEGLEGLQGSRGSKGLEGSRGLTGLEGMRSLRISRGLEESTEMNNLEGLGTLGNLRSGNLTKSETEGLESSRDNPSDNRRKLGGVGCILEGYTCSRFDARSDGVFATLTPSNRSGAAFDRAHIPAAVWTGKPQSRNHARCRDQPVPRNQPFPRDQPVPRDQPFPREQPVHNFQSSPSDQSSAWDQPFFKDQPIFRDQSLPRSQPIPSHQTGPDGQTAPEGQTTPLNVQSLSESRPLSAVRSGPIDVRCEFLVAADGASSSIRKQLQIPLEGDSAIESLLSVHFECPALREKLRGREAMLYFVFNEDVIMVVVAHDLKRGEFVAQIPFYPPQQKPAEFTPQVCQEMIQQAIGDGDHAVTVRSIRPWTMTAQVAEKYTDPSGRVFLAGDAAHRFPPAGGFGMNTGIQDAHNLAWKLAAVLRGHSDESLLRTYEQERRPIAQANTALSVANFKGAVAIPSALGLDPAAAKLLLRTLNRPPISLLPTSYQRELLERGFALGRAQMSPLLLNANNPLGRARLAEVARIIRDGESLQLQFPAEDLGFRYTQGALWTGVPDVIERAQRENAMGRRIGYEPDTAPGCRLPHCELAVARVDTRTGTVTASETLLSSLDLTNGGGLHLRLIITADRNAVKWTRALQDLQSILPLPICGAVIWPEHSVFSGSKELDKQFVNSNTCESDSQSKEDLVHLVDVHKSWAGLPGVNPGVAILVRPDGHVAWRSTVDELHELAELREGGVLQETFGTRHRT